MFLQVSVCPQGGACVAGGVRYGGVCMAGGHAWQRACMVGGCAWQEGCPWQGVVHCRYYEIW